MVHYSLWCHQGGTYIPYTHCSCYVCSGVYYCTPQFVWKHAFLLVMVMKSSLKLSLCQLPSTYARILVLLNILKTLIMSLSVRLTNCVVFKELHVLQVQMCNEQSRHGDVSECVTSDSEGESGEGEIKWEEKVIVWTMMTSLHPSLLC